MSTVSLPESGHPPTPNRSNLDSGDSLPSSNHSINHTTLVEEWKQNISKSFNVTIAPTKEEAAIRIQTQWRSRKRRKTFKTIKTVLSQAEESITRRVLKQINPSEAHLLNDPSLRSRVRFRLGGTLWPPIILYKIYTNATVRYIDGQVVTDSINGKISEQGVFSRRDYQQFISWLDRKPVTSGGRGNSWRPLFHTKITHGRLPSSSSSPNFRRDRGKRRGRNGISGGGYKVNNHHHRTSSLPSLDIRKGAGGGVSGSNQLFFTQLQSLSHSTSDLAIKKRKDQNLQIQRWQSSSTTQRRPGTTTEAGRRARREKLQGNTGGGNTTRSRRRPQSASVSRRGTLKNSATRNKGKGKGGSSSNNKRRNKSGNSKKQHHRRHGGYGRRKKISLVIGKEIKDKRKGGERGGKHSNLNQYNTTLATTERLSSGGGGLGRGKLVTPKKYQSYNSHQNYFNEQIEGIDGGVMINDKLKNKNGNIVKLPIKQKRFSMKSVTSWDTIPDAEEASDLYQWSNALNIADLDWVKTSPTS